MTPYLSERELDPHTAAHLVQFSLVLLLLFEFTLFLQQASLHS